MTNDRNDQMTTKRDVSRKLDPHTFSHAGSMYTRMVTMYSVIGRTRAEISARLFFPMQLPSFSDKHSYRRNDRKVPVKRSHTICKRRERRRQKLNLRQWLLNPRHRLINLRHNLINLRRGWLFFTVFLIFVEKESKKLCFALDRSGGRFPDPFAGNKEKFTRQ